jgi:hypothetical protein
VQLTLSFCDYCVVLQIHRVVLAACCELLATHKIAQALPAQRAAGMLLAVAVADLPPLSAGTGSTDSICSTSNSRLTAMLWEQVEQSGLLQQLPGSLNFQVAHIQQPVGQLKLEDSPAPTQGTEQLLHILRCLQHLQPSFFTGLAAGQQCLVPAMQLSLSSLQLISTVLLASSGGQEWMAKWLDTITV